VAARGARAAVWQDADHRVLGAATPLSWSEWTAAFVQRLRELGWVDGRTVSIEYRWAEGRSDRYTEIAAEFVRLKVDVIVAPRRLSETQEFFMKRFFKKPLLILAAP
jgi:hypothetical protein